MKGLGVYLVSISTTLVIIKFATFIFTKITTPDEHIIIEFDPICSDKFCKTIKDFIATHHKNCMSKSICKGLYNEFSAIKEVKYLKKMFEKSYIFLTLHQPLYYANNSRVVLEKGQIIESHYFTETSLQKVHKILLPLEYKKISNSLLKWLKDKSDKIFHAFEVHIKNSTKILLVSKDKNNMDICCTQKIHLTKEIFSHLNIIKNKLCASPCHTLSSWIADIRFKRQIIVYKRGNNERKKFI